MIQVAVQPDRADAVETRYGELCAAAAVRRLSFAERETLRMFEAWLDRDAEAAPERFSRVADGNPAGMTSEPRIVAVANAEGGENGR